MLHPIRSQIIKIGASKSERQNRSVLARFGTLKRAGPIRKLVGQAEDYHGGSVGFGTIKYPVVPCVVSILGF